MKVILYGWQKNSTLYDGFVENLTGSHVLSFLPPVFNRSYGDTADTYDSNSLLDKLDEYDLFVFTPRSLYDPNFRKALYHGTSAKKIFVDIEDDFLLRNVFKNEQIDLYFKREIITKLGAPEKFKWYLRNVYGSQLLPPIHRKLGIPANLSDSFPYKIATYRESESRLRPFPLTVRSEIIRTASPNVEKGTDLFFSQKLSTVRTRKRYFKRLAEFANDSKDFKSVIRPGGLARNEYYATLSGSKASVSLRGMGYDTDRYWEIPLFGSALFSEHLPIKIENDFLEGESALFFDDFSTFKEKFEKFVLLSDEWREIARNGRKLFLAHHTPKQRVSELVLDRL